MLGREKLETLIESSFETLEEENEDASFVGVAMLVVEARSGDGVTAWYTFCSDKRVWVQKAAIEEAGMAVEFSEVETDD